MRKNNQRRVRQNWMRKYRRAMEGHGYRLQRMEPVIVAAAEIPFTRPGKLFILKDDGREVVPRKDDRGKVSYEIVRR